MRYKTWVALVCRILLTLDLSLSVGHAQSFYRPDQRQSSSPPRKTAVATFVSSDSGSGAGNFILKIDGKTRSFFWNGGTRFNNFGNYKQAYTVGAEWRIVYSEAGNIDSDPYLWGVTFTGNVLPVPTPLSSNAAKPASPPTSIVTPRQDGLANAKKQVNAELEELKASILRKIDKDVESTSLAFTEAEYISRSLRIAYPFKAALTVISGAISSISALKNASDMKTAISYQNSALGGAAIGLALQNAWKAGEDLKFVFDGPAYTDSVERMIKDAQATQPSIGLIPAAGFDSATYRTVIENWIMGSGGGSLYLRISPDHLRHPCSRQSPDSLFGALALKTRLSSTFRGIEGQISKGNYSQEQLTDLQRQVVNLKTAILASSGKAATARYQTYQPNSQGRCELSQKELPLGTIAQYDTALRQAYAALDKRVQVEQAFTLTTVAGAVIKTVSLKVGNNEFLSIASKLIGVEKIGEYEFAKKFPLSKPRDAIVDLPQQMLLALPDELSGVWAIALDLKNYVEIASANPVTNSNPLAKTEIRKVDFKNFSYSPTLCNKEYKIGSSVRIRNGMFRTGRADDGAEFGVSNIQYGDLNSDGNEDAIVTTYCEPIPNNNAGANEWFIYTIQQNGRFILLSEMTDESLNKDYSSYFSGGVLWRSSISIKSGYLIVESAADGPHCCPKHKVTMRYRWNGQKFVLTAPPKKTPFPQ